RSPECSAEVRKKYRWRKRQAAEQSHEWDAKPDAHAQRHVPPAPPQGEEHDEEHPDDAYIVAEGGDPCQRRGCHKPPPSPRPPVLPCGTKANQPPKSELDVGVAPARVGQEDGGNTIGDRSPECRPNPQHTTPDDEQRGAGEHGVETGEQP